MTNANQIQIGGDHYRQGGSAQHWDWVEANGLGYLEGNATKYVTRWRKKNGLQDLEKARHYMLKLIELHEDGQRNNRSEFKVPRINIQAFSTANELTPDEAAFCEILFSWQNISDLRSALSIVDKLIEVHAL